MLPSPYVQLQKGVYGHFARADLAECYGLQPIAWPVVLIAGFGISKNINWNDVKDCFRMRLTLIFLASFGCPASRLKKNKKESSQSEADVRFWRTEADGEEWLGARPN